MSIRHGRYVQGFDWPGAQTRHGGPIWGELAAAYRALNDAADASRERSKALSRDPNFTDAGRRSQMADWYKGAGRGALAGTHKALQAAEEAIAARRGNMAAIAIDKTDVAAAMLRSELRTWLRSMQPADRIARLTMGDLPAEAVAAILEAPAELSGVTAKQRQALEESHLTVRFPEDAAFIAEVEEAMGAIVTAYDAARHTMSKDGVGMSPESLDADANGGAVPGHRAERARYFAEKHGLAVDEKPAGNSDDPEAQQAA